MGIQVYIAGLTDEVEVADVLVNIVCLKNNFLGNEAEKVPGVNYRHVIAAEFLHPYDGFVGIVSSLEGRYHVVNQVLCDHVTVFNALNRNAPVTR